MRWHKKEEKNEFLMIARARFPAIFHHFVLRSTHFACSSWSLSIARRFLRLIILESRTRERFRSRAILSILKTSGTGRSTGRTKDRKTRLISYNSRKNFYTIRKQEKRKGEKKREKKGCSNILMHRRWTSAPPFDNDYISLLENVELSWIIKARRSF